MGRKLLLSIYLTCLISSSCSDQLSGFVNSYVQNDSQSNVEIEFYGSQSENILEAISVEKGGKIIVLNSVAQESISYPVYLSTLNLDSAILYFDNENIVHYNYNINGNNEDALPYNDPTNIFNVISWNKKVLKDNKRRFEAEYTFTISN
jgi:hypothetical protein